MGGNNSKAKTQEELLREYEEFKKEYDPRFEEVTIYKNKLHPNKELMLTKNYLFQQKKEYELFNE